MAVYLLVYYAAADRLLSKGELTHEEHMVYTCVSAGGTKGTRHDNRFAASEAHSELKVSGESI